MVSPLDEVHVAAHNVKKLVPAEAWEALLVAINLYANLKTTLLVGASRDLLERTQGHAQCSVEVFQMLANCTAKAREIETKQR